VTGHLLQSDVDFARRLLREGVSGERVVQALCLRKVNPKKANSAVRDLCFGLDVRGEDLDSPEAFATVTKSATVPSPTAVPTPAAAPAPVAMPTPAATSAPARRLEPEPEPEPELAASSSRSKGWLWLAVLGLFAASFGVWMWTSQRPKIHATSQEVTAHKVIDAPPPKLSMPAAALRRQTPGVQVQDGKVSIGGVELQARNAFSELNQALGAPSRTNKLDGLVLYTYDDHGIVLYSSGGTGKDSLVIYLEPMGGSKGVQKAFSGPLSVEGKLVLAASEQGEISGIPNLGLKQTVTNIFAGQSGELGISFAYLKGADQLTMVQVDLN
jgi:hypothetical protein